MKLLAAVIALTVIVLVIVGYDLLAKAFKKRNESVPNEMKDAFDSYQKQQSNMENLKNEIKNSQSKNK